METKKIIKKFNKVSGYDFNTLKEWGITTDAVIERTDSRHLGMAYEWLITAVLREETIGTDIHVLLCLDIAKFRLTEHTLSLEKFVSN